MANLFDSTNTNQSISLTLTYDSCKNGYLTEFWLVGYEKESIVQSWSRYIKTHILGSKGDPLFLGAHNFQHEQNHGSPKRTMGVREGVLEENTKMLPKYFWGE